MCPPPGIEPPARGGCRSRAARWSARARSARARPRRSREPRFAMKFACTGEIWAPPIRCPFKPTDSISRPAWSPGGFTKTEPQEGTSSGCVARALREVPLDLGAHARGLARLHREQRGHDQRARRETPELAVAHAQPLARQVDAPAAARTLDLDFDQHLRQVSLRHTGVHRDPAADAARDARGELETRRARAARRSSAPGCARRRPPRAAGGRGAARAGGSASAGSRARRGPRPARGC